MVPILCMPAASVHLKPTFPLYVSHSQRTIVVVDYFTGKGPEPLAHARKGMQYAGEADIKKYLDQGYSYHYGAANPNNPH